MTEPEQQQPALVENMLLMRREDFEELLDHAAERGAVRCLAQLGLENGHAARDIRGGDGVTTAHLAAAIGTTLDALNARLAG